MPISNASEQHQAHVPFFHCLPSGVLADILTQVGSSGRGILKHVSKSLRNAVLEYRVAEGQGEPDHLKLSKKWHPSLVRSTTPAVSRRTRSLTGVGDGHAIALRDLCVSVDLLVWSRWQGAPWDDNRWCWLVCPLAAKGGHLESLIYATREGILLCPATCEGAAAGGHLGILKWARAMDCHWDGRTTAVIPSRSLPPPAPAPAPVDCLEVLFAVVACAAYLPLSTLEESRVTALVSGPLRLLRRPET